MAYKLRVKVTRIRQRVVQFRESTSRLHCESCGREVEMLTGAEALEAVGVDRELMASLISDGTIHAIEPSADDKTWVCRDSLFFELRGK
jgi:hypothetical protein